MSTETVEVVQEVSDGDATRCSECQKKVASSSTVDVAAGRQIGKWSKKRGIFDATPAHVGVTGVGSHYPSTEEWCRACATEQFGPNVVSDSSLQEEIAANPYVTGSNVASFLAGAIFILLLIILL